MNSKKAFPKINPNNIQFIGNDLNKPTTIIARNQKLWVPDSRGGVLSVDLATQQQEIFLDPKNEHDQFSGIIFLDDTNLILANVGAGCIEHFDLSKKKREVMFDAIDGMPLGKVNFIFQDSKKRIWVTVSTRRQNLLEALNPDIADGYIALIENNKIRIVAEGFSLANEARLDNKEEYLYVVETGRKHITRMKVHLDGSLSDREIFGPDDLGSACFPDGITFDKKGNLWGTIIGAEKIFVITPDGQLEIIYDDGEIETIKKIESAYQHRSLTPEILFSGKSKLTPIMTSLTFLNENVYVGSYGTKIPYFKMPSNCL